MSSNPLTTHVLDTSSGKPAAGLPVTLERETDSGFVPIGEGVTNDDGRLSNPLVQGEWSSGVYRITFDTATYFASQQTRGFYPTVKVVFEVTEPDSHHHVPLLLSPFGYSTYRGS
ncbi:MAG: hydroxyisourate hydrolase [Myxococcota bacterium]